MKTRAVIYARTSDKRQDIDGQVKACRELAEEREMLLVGEYLDVGVSGDTPDLASASVRERRLAFETMFLRALVYQDFKSIICWSDDRFSRLSAALDIKWKLALRRLEIELVFCSDWPPPALSESLLTEGLVFRVKGS